MFLQAKISYSPKASKVGRLGQTIVLTESEYGARRRHSKLVGMPALERQKETKNVMPRDPCFHGDRSSGQLGAFYASVAQESLFTKNSCK